MISTDHDPQRNIRVICTASCPSLGLCSIACCLLLLAACINSTSVAAEVATESADFSCGVASLYAVLTLMGEDITYGMVRARIEHIAAATELDRLDFSQLRQVLHDSGFCAEVAQFPRSSNDSLPTPSIIYIDAKHFNQFTGINSDMPSVGHAAVLMSIDQYDACVIDLTASFYPISMSRERFNNIWSGKMITVSKPIFGYSPRTIGIVYIVSSFVFFSGGLLFFVLAKKGTERT